MKKIKSIAFTSCIKIFRNQLVPVDKLELVMSDLHSSNNSILLLNSELAKSNYDLKYYFEEAYNLKLKIELISELSSNTSLIHFQNYLSQNLPKSNAQLLQDLIVSYLFQHTTSGCFCEFGAADGKTLSNTFMLEHQFEWRGIVCEPSLKWHEALRSNRNCIIDADCVFSESGLDLIFRETADGMLSTISDYAESDIHAKLRLVGEEYVVKSISLSDLLKKHNAPKNIDFLSVDTEGSEWDILKNFPFTEYSFGAIFVEHNFGENRSKVQALMYQAGYRQILTDYSRWDDWFISQELYDKYPDLQI